MATDKPDEKETLPDQNGEKFELIDFTEDSQGNDAVNSSVETGQTKTPGGFYSYQKEEEKSEEENLKDLVFIQDHGIVSSIEDYVLRVREDADEYAAERRAKADAYHDKLIADIDAKAESMRQKRIKLEDDIREMTEERDKIYAAIKKDAHKEGFREGKNEILDKSEENLKTIAGITEDLDNFYRKLLAKYEKDIMETALLIAGKIIRSEITVNKDMVEETAKNILKRAKHEGTVKLYIHPADYQLIGEKIEAFGEYLDGKGDISIVQDDEIHSGTLQIDTDLFHTDSDITKQLEQVNLEIQKAYHERLMNLLQKK